jgi:hypothetical protein
VIVDEIVDVGPAAPAAAFAGGIVLIDKKDGVHVARRGPMPRGNRAAASPFTPIDLPREACAPYGRGPAIVEGQAYWVSQGRLTRRRLDGSGEAEILARDARTGTRVSAARLDRGGALAVYVVAPKSSQTPRAKLWLEGGKTYELTPDGAGASSVALVSQRTGWTALALDGRSAMTPLHARRIVATGKDVTLGSDVVVWVGASAQSTTEIVAGTRGDDVWGLVAIELDVLHFGLAQIHVGIEPRLDAKVAILPFENGINTAPIATAEACGKSLVVFARPASKEPGAPQELVIAELTEDGIVGGEAIARSRAFADCSLARLENGAALAYTADHRTWAATIRCRR